MVPVLIQDLAARNGVETSDHSKACDTSMADYKCVMPVFGPHYLDPGTVALYISSFSALVSFVISLSISPIADYGRKYLLLLFFFCHLVMMTQKGCTLSPRSLELVVCIGPP